MITIVPTTTCYASDIRNIEVESFSAPWSLDDIKFEINNKHSICFTAIKDSNTVVGHVTMRHIVNEGYVSNIAVLQSYRRLGVGSMLLDALINEGIKREMIGITLEVRVSNLPAISLYEKYGFVIEGYRKNFYSSPSENAAIMWKYLHENEVLA